MKLIKILILGCFIFWWGVILFFNLPESSLPIAENYSLYKTWNVIFFKRWEFFAPPPNYDDRLYYVYTDLKKPENITNYEVFKTLHKKRKKGYFFNNRLSNLDQTLHSISTSTTDLIKKNYEIYKFQQNCDTALNNSDCFQKYVEKVSTDFHETQNLTILIKHAKEIAILKSITDAKVQIILSAKELPKFKDRHKIDAKRKEYMLFISNYYNLETEKWEKSQE